MIPFVIPVFGKHWYKTKRRATTDIQIMFISKCSSENRSPLRRLILMEKQEIKLKKCGVPEAKEIKYLRKKYMINSSGTTKRTKRFINKEFTDALSKNSFILKIHDMKTSPQG